MLKIEIEEGTVGLQMNGTVPVLVADCVNILRVLDHRLATSPVPQQSPLFRQLFTLAVLEGKAWEPVTGDLTSIQVGYPVGGGFSHGEE